MRERLLPDHDESREIIFSKRDGEKDIMNDESKDLYLLKCKEKNTLRVKTILLQKIKSK